MPRHEESSKNPLVQGKTYSWHTETQKMLLEKKPMGFSTFSQKSIHGQSHVKMFSTGVLAGWVETVQQTIWAAAPFLKPQTLAYEAKEISVEHQNMLWKMIRIEIVDLPIKNGGFIH